MCSGTGCSLCVQVIADVEQAVCLVTRVELQREQACQIPDQHLLGQIEKDRLRRRAQVRDHLDPASLLDYKQPIGLTRRSAHGYGINEAQVPKSLYRLVSETLGNLGHVQGRIGDPLKDIGRLRADIHPGT